MTISPQLVVSVSVYLPLGRYSVGEFEAIGDLATAVAGSQEARTEPFWSADTDGDGFGVAWDELDSFGSVALEHALNTLTAQKKVTIILSEVPGLLVEFIAK